jgi:hypothetical protein
VVAGDGSLGDDYEAFYWNESLGMVNLRDLLIANGVTNLTGWTLTYANAVSADGLTIVGNAVNPAGNQEAWVATIPEPHTLTLAALAIFAFLMSLLRRRRLL